MKKVIVMLVCVMSIGAAGAQENKSKKFELGASYGMITFNNYSALSLFQDATPSYTAWGETIHLGYRTNNGMLGLRFNFATFNTSAIALNETSGPLGLSFMLRHDASISKHFEVGFGVSCGLAAWVNTFSYQGLDYNRVRWCANGECEIGLNYTFNDISYVGLRVGIIVMGRTSQTDMDLPVGLVANERKNFDGYSIAMQYGIRF